MKPTATSASVKVSPDQTFDFRLTAEQVKLVLQVMSEAHFRGDRVMLAAATISAIQDAVMLTAHDPNAKVNQ